MLNKIITTRNETNTATNITNDPDNRIIIKPQNNTFLKVVKTDSEQFREFSNGEPYLLDETIEKPDKWHPYYSGRRGAIVKRTVKKYLVQKVEIVEMQIDNKDNAYVTYRKIQGDPKYYSQREEETPCYAEDPWEMAKKLNMESY